MVKPVQDPQSAREYEDRTTQAAKSVLIEIGQILGSFRGRFAIIGGAVPWLLLDNEEMPHVGTLDVDLSLDAAALGDGEYVRLVDALMKQGCSPGSHVLICALRNPWRSAPNCGDADRPSTSRLHLPVA